MRKKFTEVDFEMFTMPWGVNVGKTLAELPASYLLYIAEQDYAPPILKAYVDENLDELTEKSQDEELEFQDCNKFETY